MFLCITWHPMQSSLRTFGKRTGSRNGCILLIYLYISVKSKPVESTVGSKSIFWECWRQPSDTGTPERRIAQNPAVLWSETWCDDPVRIFFCSPFIFIIIAVFFKLFLMNVSSLQLKKLKLKLRDDEYFIRLSKKNLSNLSCAQFLKRKT